MFEILNYIYCTVTFGDGKSYYYRTFDKKIRPGSKVIVPVGRYNAHKIGTVLTTATYKRKNAPYPVKQTKVIVEIAGKNAERKVEKYNRNLLKAIVGQQNRQKKKQMDKLAEKNRKQLELEWIDRIEEYDALFNE